MKRKIGLVFLLLMLAASAACAHENHTFGPYKTKISATCQHAGLEFRYCTGCDHWEKREIPKLAHTPGEWEVTQEPTCTRKGIKQTYCTVCGDRMRRYIDMLPHEYGEMEVVTEPTCTKTGKGQYICATCGRKKSETIAKLGHDWVDTSVTKEPTCHDYGSGEQTCQRCGRTRTGRLDKLEHEWSEWAVISEPDGGQAGVCESTCALCGDVRSENFYAEGTLYQDMEPNEDVLHMQEMLRDLGYYNGNIRTGTFGSLTAKAVLRFQAAHELPVTGVADEETLQRIESEWALKTGGTVAL